MINVVRVQNFEDALFSAVDFCGKNLTSRVEIVVPDKLSLFMEKFLFEQLNLTCSFNISVSTLNRFAKRNLIVDKDKQISKNGSILLIHKLLNEHLQEFSVLKSGAYSFKYAEEIYKTIAQLKSSKIDWEEMKRFKSTNVQLENKIHDLAKIFEWYENEKAGLLDATDLFTMSAFTVAEGRENSKIYFVGFDDFTAIEYLIISCLADKCDVSVVDYFSKSDNKNIYSSEVYNSLKAIAYKNEIGFKVSEFQREKSGLKRFISDHLFGVSNEKFVLDNEAVKLFSGNKFVSEIEFVARDIREKIVSGESFGKFGLAVFSLEEHIEKIKEVFKKYEINCYFDQEISLNKSVLYKFLVSVLKFNLDGYQLVNLIDMINSPFFELEAEQKRAITQKLCLMNFRGKIGASLDLGEELNDAKTKLIEFVNLFSLDGVSNIEEFLALLTKADEALNFDEVLSTLSEEMPLQERLTLTKSKEMIFDTLSEIKQFYPDANMQTVYDIFTHISELIKCKNLPQTIDAVKILDADNCLEIFENLYILNCTYSSAPSLKNDYGIILDSEIEVLNFANKLSPTIAHINRLAQFRLYNLANNFVSSLTITFSNNASSLIKEFENKIEIDTELGRMSLAPFTNSLGGNYEALSKWDYIEHFCKYFNEFDLKNEKNNEFGLTKLKNYKIDSENLNKINQFKTISASHLESYFKCPFSHFLQNTLKIKPRLESDILSLDVGNILHEILFDYYHLNKQVGDIYEFCKTKVFEFIEKDVRLKLNAKSPVILSLIDEAVRVISGVNYIDQNSAFKPKYFEREFKGGEALKLGNVNLIGKVDRLDEFENNLRIVDYKSGRADASLKELFYGNKLQLFLYALAMENATNKHVVGGFYLPLHNAYTTENNTYSLKGFFENEKEIVQALDLRLQAGDKSDIVNVRLTKDELACRTNGYKELSTQEFQALKMYAKNVSTNAIEEIQSGKIAPTPSAVRKPCEYCPYKTVCLKDSACIEFRPAKKVTLESFLGGQND